MLTGPDTLSFQNKLRGESESTCGDFSMPVDFLATHKLLPVNNKAQDRFVKFYIMYIYRYLIQLPSDQLKVLILIWS